ncbi:putative zinc metalloprotease [Plectosphaerella cucumerina]|uniref:Peptide hydrolase n=1 Tax=Plectosphaerella cucumerina TaxID=40658 RepID=A0A8K0TDZ7_9PEZI|nr:putative zinc metalloprotease [Plectosphaerella cucumerina]
MRCHNPFGFRPGPVTLWTVVIYAALLIPLVWIHESVPPVPSTIPAGINLTEAWWDLTTISRDYHPYNSHENEVVGDYLLQRISEILDRSGLHWTKEDAGGVKWGKSSIEPRASSPAVTVFDDNVSNVTWASGSKVLSFGNAGYFEGTNKMIYIRGTEDEEGEWWRSPNRDVRLIGRGGVLVNAHYDSVSTGYGATDDGVGVVCVLQLLKYFTTEGNQPKRGMVLLLNNAEEDGLLGAKAFAYSPLLSFPTTFVNVEGAGAGGRAILFRASDREVVGAYRKARHPFGTVLASDGFELGLVRSQTDYVIFEGIFGMRGLDVAFYRPRPRYHTNEDDARHTSRESIWHMLSTTLPAIESLSNDVSDRFAGARPDQDRNKVPSGKPTSAVWFDMFGAGFAVFGLRGLFAWALTLLIVSPLILFLVTYILIRKDKYYLFSGKLNIHDQGSEDPVSIGGFRGLVRLPFAFAVAGALTFASALLVRKVNPLIIYTSPYAVWAMTLSLFYIAFWVILKGASVVRPTALQRIYAHIWIFTFSWGLLILMAVFADRFRIAAFYPFAFLHSSVFLSTLIGLFDLFALEPKRDYARRVHDDHQTRDHINEVPHADALIAPAAAEENTCSPPDGSDDEDEEPTENTPLTGNSNSRTTFGSTYRRSISAIRAAASPTRPRHQPYGKEQSWSGRLPKWTWLAQLLLLVPINVILFGQVALLITSATQNVRGDGGSDITAYLGIAAFTTLILLPLGPFIHRVSFHVPITILSLIFIGSLLYNLIAFPFSAESRYKVYFQQDLYLENGTTAVKISGVEEYVRQIIPSLPSSSGKEIECERQKDGFLSECRYDGAALAPFEKHKDLITVDLSRGDSGKTVTLSIDAKNSKICSLNLEKPIHKFAIRKGADIDPRFGQFPDEGVKSISLFRRDTKKPWVVEVETEHAKGTVECQWDEAGKIPAYVEALQYSPVWVAFTKTRSGLLRGVQPFKE